MFQVIEGRCGVAGEPGWGPIRFSRPSGRRAQASGDGSDPDARCALTRAAALRVAELGTVRGGPGSVKRDSRLARKVHEAWRERLIEEVPRSEIPAYLNDLQALVAGLRQWREAQQVPSVEAVSGFLTPSLVAHDGLTVAYITDARYQEIVRLALERGR